MKYYISNSICKNIHDVIVLKPDNWDDYCYRTTFNAIYVDSNGEYKILGSIKIGLKGAVVTDSTFYIKEFLPDCFEKLPEDFFSLWQSADSYQKLKEINEKCKGNIFEDLRDIAYNLELCEKYLKESILQNSLIRSISLKTIENQFHRITIGQAKLTTYKFAYEIGDLDSKVKLTFNVTPDSLPPTNIHALIGGNGIGKTTLIRNMIEGILKKDIGTSNGKFLYDCCDNEHQSDQFVNVICVAFSPFDDFSSLEKNVSEMFSYIGTKKKYILENEQNNNEEVNLLKDIEEQFIDSLKSCLGNLTKRKDLSDVIKILENDPMFYNYRIGELIIRANEEVDYDNMSSFRTIFSSMSSGHKVVLSTIVRCIDKIVEKTILFLDEPENYLHPPLVSSLIRAISTVLTRRNGVAIISTHSPIVLQEIPKSCVWILSRNGDMLNAMRPRFETFGENIGSLTNDVFRYEINNSGFHALLKESVLECKTFEDVMDKYKNQLGDEARGLLYVLFSQKERGEL